MPHLCGLRQLFHPHAGDAVSVHLQHGVAAALMLHLVAGARDGAQAKEQKTGQRLEAGIRRDLDAKLGFQIADARSAVQFDLAGIRVAAHVLLIVLILDAAHQASRLRRTSFSSCSSSMRPTRCSSTSFSVSIPTMVPNSSTTMAMWEWPARNCSSICESGLVSGTTRCGRSNRPMWKLRLAWPERMARRRSSQTGSRSL